MEALDPSQKAAEPTQTISGAELTRRLREGSLELAEVVEGKQVNREHAAMEIASIFELKDSAPFQWFERQFIDPEYQKAFDALRNPASRQPGETLELVQARYVALREVKAGMLEREIAHRELLDLADQEIVRLRQRLNLL